MLNRRGQAKDAAKLIKLALKSKAYWGYDDVFMLACKDELHFTKVQIESPKRQFGILTLPVPQHIGAKCENAIQGFITFEFLSPQTLEIKTFLIHPDSIEGRNLLLMIKQLLDK